MLGAVLMAACFAGTNGVMQVTLAELFPTRVRTVAYGIGYNLGTAIFGGAARWWSPRSSPRPAAPGSRRSTSYSPPPSPGSPRCASRRRPSNRSSADPGPPGAATRTRHVKGR
ncbi:hypothetical protein NKH77_08060 [Streptomyces sp. M19]